MSIRLLLWRRLARDQRITKDRALKHKQFKRDDTLRTPVLPRLHSEVVMLASATCAALGGAGHMTLAEWRDVEEQLKRKLAYEKCKTHQ